MIETADYSVTLRSTGPKEGVAESVEAELPSLRVAAPPEFGGPGGEWSPEHLFVASVASCFMTTFAAIAKLSQIDILDLEVPATGTIERGDDRRYRFVRVLLEPQIRLSEGARADRAERVAQKAEQACLISRSLSTEVVVASTIRIEEATTAGRAN